MKKLMLVLIAMIGIMFVVNASSARATSMAGVKYDEAQAGCLAGLLGVTGKPQAPESHMNTRGELNCARPAEQGINMISTGTYMASAPVFAGSSDAVASISVPTMNNSMFAPNFDYTPCVDPDFAQPGQPEQPGIQDLRLDNPVLAV